VAGRKEKYTNAHLPAGCQENGAWRRIVIPTYLQYLASRDSDSDAWAANDDEGISIQQRIWDFVYGDKVPHIITVQGPVFALVSVHFFLQVPSSILISHLSRSTNAFANGVVDLLLLLFPSSMRFLMTTNTKLTKNVKSSQSLV
jgi:hypothetical protein